jgi:hypothetical protein
MMQEMIMIAGGIFYKKGQGSLGYHIHQQLLRRSVAEAKFSIAPIPSQLVSEWRSNLQLHPLLMRSA